jgi:hypothetical protein
VLTGPERLAEVAAALEGVGLPYLVMGGHAVRYYGVDRNTIDFDLHVSLDDWDRLPEVLGRSALFAGRPPVEGPSWRPRVFRRFQIGRLPDGREEWLEFWRANHLLAPFPDLVARSETGAYGGRPLRFLGLGDLIRSKETERASDWQDVALLEEIRDGRNVAAARQTGDYTRALAELRSRKGFEALFASDPPPDLVAVRAAVAPGANPITVAFLAPYLAGEVVPVHFEGVIGEVIAGPVRAAPPSSARHLALVEAVRRLYKQGAIAADRADKEAARRGS